MLFSFVIPCIKQQPELSVVSQSTEPLEIKEESVQSPAITGFSKQYLLIYMFPRMKTPPAKRFISFGIKACSFDFLSKNKFLSKCEERSAF